MKTLRFGGGRSGGSSVEVLDLNIGVARHRLVSTCGLGSGSCVFLYGLRVHV